MATTQNIGLDAAHFVADVDLTSFQYYFVTAASTAGRVKLATGASNPAPLGILQNSPSAGEGAVVTLLGPAKAYVITPAGSGLGFARYLTVNASGQGIPFATDGGSVFNARNIGAAVAVSSSQVAEVFVWPWAACAISAS